MVGWDFVWYFLYFFEEATKYYFVYSAILCLERKKDKKLYGIAFGVIMLVSSVLLCICPEIIGIFEPVCYFIVVSLIFLCNWKVKLLAFIPICMGISFVDQIVACIAGMILNFNPLTVAGYENVLCRFLLALPLWIVLIIMEIYTRCINPKKWKKIELTKGGYLLCVSAILCLSMLMSLASYMVFEENMEVVLSMAKGVVVFAIANVIILLLFGYVIFNLMKVAELKNEMLLVYKEKNRVQNEYYQVVHRKNEELSRFRHDYHHHMKYLLEQLQNSDYEAMEEYLQSLNIVGEDVMQENYLYSGNHVVDAIINGIIPKKENEDIVFRYRGKLPDELKIKDIDLSIILSNALENAVEACRECDGIREIDMKISKYGGNIMICIRNTCQSKRIKKGNTVRTNKTDYRYHGDGIQSMKKVIEVYDGSLEMEAENDIFLVTIQLNEKQIK